MEARRIQHIFHMEKNKQTVNPEFYIQRKHPSEKKEKSRNFQIKNNSENFSPADLLFKKNG